ncbi:MAG: FAD:protein FMN transferase, partial [Thermoguttaceae bacterium]
RFLFHGGLSSVLAAGTGWKVGVAHPIRRGKRLAELNLSNQAIGTSGADKQFFMHHGRRYSHLIDPRTGEPVSDVLAVTVLAPNGTVAELCSTAFFVMGFDWASKFCVEHPELAALFTLPDSRPVGFQIKHFGFASQSVQFFEYE